MDINNFLRKGLILSAIGVFIIILYFIMLKYSTLLIVDGLAQPPLRILYTIFTCGALIFHSLLCIIVLLNNPRRTVNRVFFLLSSFIAMWILGCAIQTLTQDIRYALFAENVFNKFAFFTPSLFLHSYYEILNIKGRKLIAFGYLYSVSLFLLSFSSYFSSGVSYYAGVRYITDPGLLYVLFPLLVIIASYCSLIRLISERSRATGYKRIQLDYLLFAGTSIIIAVFFSFMLVYKVAFTPFDELLNIIYGIAIGYAILKHRLMDITIVFRKGLIYSMLIGLLAGTYISTIYIFTNYIGGFGDRRSILFSIVAIFIFAILFQPLRDKIQDLIDAIFFRGKYDYQKTLRALSLTARSIAGIDELADKMLSSVVDVIKINKAAMYILDKRNNSFMLRKSIGDVPTGLENKLIEKLIAKKETISYEDASNNSENDYPIVFPILSKEQLVGMLCLGVKLSGEVYSDEDIDLLTTLCNQMGVSIENAMLYEDALETQKQLFQADKLATVGALAAGLAHEIKNPIAAIKGFSQVIDKAVKEKDAEAINDFKEVVPRQLDRINEIVEKLLSLSKPQKPEKRKVNINGLLEEIIRLVEKQAVKQTVAIIRTYGDILLTMADPQQLTQAFLNIILNAIQSMPSGGKVEISTRMMGKDKIVIEIQDSGMGIKKEMLSKIFDPFYTTKEGGSGLGLAVTQKIIVDHHGKIAVESDVNSGTLFSVILPVEMA